MPTSITRTVPKNSLAYLFPQGFNEFWQQVGIKDSLEKVIYHYVPASTDREEIKKTLASGGYGWTAIAITGHFTERYWFRSFEPWPDDFINQFKTNLVFVISDIRRKEHLWSQLFRDLDKLLKPLKLKSDTRTSHNYDKTQVIGGKTINTGQENINRNEQKQITSKNTPVFSNVDLGSREFGGFGRQQQLATQQTEQGQNQQSSNKKNTTDKINHVNKEHYRSNKDANLITVNQDTYELNSVARLLNSYAITLINFPEYYKLFDKLFIKLFGASGYFVDDEITGQRKWVSQPGFGDEIIEQGGDGKPTIPDGNEWDENLPYLERLQIYHGKNEKELKKLPDTSNRKPRVAIRVKTGEGLISAYEKDTELPLAQLFKDRIEGKVESYHQVIGYEEIIKYITDYLDGWEFYNEFGGDKPEQLMIGLLGDPGLGKTYISQTIGKALGVGFHQIKMNGKKDSSIVYGTNIENPGAEIGEILKGVSRNQSQSTLMFFDEVEKAGKEAKDSLGDPTDRTSNKTFRDNLYDFPTPLSNIIYFCALNYPEELPDFIRDRFRMVEVLPPSYQARLAILRVNLQAKLKSLDNAFQKIYNRKWEEIYTMFDTEALLKKALTKTMSIRGAKDNIILSLIPTLISEFLKPKKALPNQQEIINYDWKFKQKEELDRGDARRGRLPCPYAVDETRQATHRVNCKCFMASLDRVPGWKENMEA